MTARRPAHRRSAHRKPAHRRSASRSGFLLTTVAAAVLASGFVLALTIRISVPAASSPVAMTARAAAPAPGFPYRHIIRPEPATRPATAAARTYTVRDGDYLSGIALRLCGRASDWTGIYAANRAVIGADPDLIFRGQVYAITRCTDPPALLHLAARPAARGDRDSDNGGTATRTVYAPFRSGTFSYAGLKALWEAAGGSYATAATAACIAEHESSGESWQVSPTEDYGLWQVNRPSWGAALATLDPYGNARAAVKISNGGSDWSAWATHSMCGA